MPFYELFLFCDFGDFDGKTFAETMISVFEQGYDLRFGVTMAIPVIMEELMIKSIWMIRQKFIRKRSWKESFPTSQHADLRIMLIVGNSTLCLIDSADAAVHGVAGGNVVSFICHLNLVGWVRLILLVLKELKIRFGSVISDAVVRFVDEVFTDMQTPAEKERIQDFCRRLEIYDRHLTELLDEFVVNVEKEYQELYSEINATFDVTKNSLEQASHSVRLAEISGVEEDRIIRSRKDLDDLFG